MTYLFVVLGELAPKSLTLDRAEKLAALVARPIAFTSTESGENRRKLTRRAASAFDTRIV